MQRIDILWRDIPSQVLIKRGRDRGKYMLTARFQEAIDRAAMRLQRRFRAAAEATGLQPAACARRSQLCACELADNRRGAPTVGSTCTAAQAPSTSATEAFASSSPKVELGAVLVRFRVEMRRAARHRLRVGLELAHELGERHVEHRCLVRVRVRVRDPNPNPNPNPKP